MKVVFFAVAACVEDAQKDTHPIEAVACEKVSDGMEYMLNKLPAGYMVAWHGDSEGHKSDSIPYWYIKYEGRTILVQGL